MNIPAPAWSDFSSLAHFPLVKGHGTGNDFILLADAEASLPLSAALVSGICDRHRGIGADGFIRAVSATELPEGQKLREQEPELAWFMDYYNADGSVSEMCGNGVRVFTEFLRQQGLAQLEAGGVLPIGTRAGIKYVRLIGEGRYAVDMGPWAFGAPQAVQNTGSDASVTVPPLQAARQAISVNMGNPHTVVVLDAEAELAALELYRPPIVEPIPTAGSNVEFLVADGPGRVQMRVHERGSGETLSCGTGACAVGVVARHVLDPERNHWQIQVPGGELEVRFFKADNGVEHVELSGPAELVAELRLLQQG